MNPADPAPRKKASRSLRFLLVVCILLLLPYAMGRLLLVNDALTPADAAAALGGDAGLARLEKAAVLYHQGMVQYIVLTETGTVMPDGTKESTALRKEALALGVPASDISITVVDASSTWNEARAVRKLMLQKGWTSCIVVTDPYHTLRAKLAFQRDFRPHDLNVQVTYTHDHWWRPSTWVLSAQGRETTLREWVKVLGQLLGFERYELDAQDIAAGFGF